MNAVEKNALQILFDELVQKPSFRIISQLEKYKDTVETIDKNLHEENYSSPFDFTIDIRMLFYNCKEDYKGRNPELLILEELSNWFEKKINKIPHSKEEYEQKMIKHHIKAISKIETAISLQSRNLKVEKVVENPPNIYCYDQLQDAIYNVTSIEEMKKVLTILKKHGVMIEPGSLISIPFDKIPQSCVDELIEFFQIV